MVDFSHLQRLHITPERTAFFSLFQVSGEPRLKVASATDGNKAYYNALLSRSKLTLRRARANGLTGAVLEQVRDNDRHLYALHVVKGWENVVDSAGNAVPFSVDACEQFLNAIPNWIFDQMRSFCGDNNNFVEDEEMNSEEESELSGN